jgi:hypothetical protein
MSQAQTILQQFLNKETECFDFQKSLFEYYKTTDRTEDIQQEILDIIRSLDKDETVRKDMWRVYFAPDREMHRKIDLLEVELLAKKAHEDNISEPHPVLLKMSASLAWGNCDRSSSGVINQEKAQIWLDTFKDMPDFKTYFQKEIKRSEEFELSCKVKYPDYYNEIEEKKNRPIVESYEIFVPVKATSNNPSIWTTKEIDTLINDVIGSFNEIGLYGYMDSFKNKCIHSHIEFQNGFIFTFDCYEKIEDLINAKKNFCGQLSDGWGSNASQIRLLIGKEIVSLDWELDQIGDFIVKQPKNVNTNKPK